MDESFIRSRITELREQKGVSEYRMSLDLGHSKNYIRTITNGGALPSMREFLYLCAYLGVTPQQFFDTDKNASPQLHNQVLDALHGLSDEDVAFLLDMIQKLKAR